MDAGKGQGLLAAQDGRTIRLSDRFPSGGRKAAAVVEKQISGCFPVLHRQSGKRLIFTCGIAPCVADQWC